MSRPSWIARSIGCPRARRRPPLRRRLEALVNPASSPAALEVAREGSPAENGRPARFDVGGLVRQRLRGGGAGPGRDPPEPRPARRLAPPSELVAEAVNDHIRVISSTHPVDIESGGIHQVKPWFTGRLDFAPRVAFSGDDDFPLVGGSVGYFRDRKAAVFVFKRRLHTITLLVFPPDGLRLAERRSVARRPAVSLRRRTRAASPSCMWRDGGPRLRAGLGRQRARSGGAGRRELNAESDRGDRWNDSAPPTFTGQEVTMSFDRDRRDILKLMAVGGVVFASGLAGAAAGRRRKSDRAPNPTSSSCSCPTRTGAIRGVSNPRGRRDAAARDRDDQRARRAARLHRLHRRPHPHHRRRRRPPQAHDASSGASRPA